MSPSLLQGQLGQNISQAWAALFLGVPALLLWDSALSEGSQPSSWGSQSSLQMDAHTKGPKEGPGVEGFRLCEGSPNTQVATVWLQQSGEGHLREGRDKERHTLVLTGVIRDLSIGYQLGGWLIPAARLFLLEYKASLAPTEIGARDADAVMLTAMVPFSAEVEG